MTVAITTEEWVARASKQLNNHDIDYSKVEYTGQANKVLVGCKLHGTWSYVLAKSHLRGESRGCAVCRKEKKAAVRRSLRAPFSEVKKKLQETGRLVSITADESTYDGQGRKMRFVCDKHGEFFCTPSNFILNTHGCPTCAKKAMSERMAITAGEWWQRIREIHGDKFKYPGFSDIDFTLEGNQTKIVVVCPDHGQFSQQVQAHVIGHGCPKCANNHISDRLITPWSQRLKTLIAAHPDANYNYDESTYSGANHKMRIVCPKHGEFWQSPWQHLSYGCPDCGTSLSHGENELFAYIKKLCPDALDRNRKIIGPKELDVVVPSKKIAFEYNGIHWHSENRLPIDYHRLKTKLCKEKGYRLIHIWQDDWRYKNDVMKNFISAQLCKLETIYAREVEIVDLYSGVAHIFLASNHVQGFANSTHYFGLYYEGYLVAVCSFVTNYKEYVLNRYAVLAGYRVIGGLGKCVKHFLRFVGGGELVSFCDLTMFTGKSYEAAGFEKVSVNYQTYSFVVKENKYRTIRIPQKTVTKSYVKRLLGDKYSGVKSIVQNMKDNGYYRIFGSGIVKYRYKGRNH